MSNYNIQNQKMMEKQANDDNDNITKDTTMETIHKFAVRIKIQAEDRNTAHKHHRNLMETIAKETTQFKLYSNNNDILDMNAMTTKHFNYHEIGKQTNTLSLYTESK